MFFLTFSEVKVKSNLPNVIDGLSGVTKGGGQLPPGAAGEGAQNRVQNSLVDATTKVCLMRFVE